MRKMRIERGLLMAVPPGDSVQDFFLNP